MVSLSRVFHPTTTFFSCSPTPFHPETESRPNPRVLIRLLLLGPPFKPLPILIRFTFKIDLSFGLSTKSLDLIEQQFTKQFLPVFGSLLREVI
jgi:hypothetical protein